MMQEQLFQKKQLLQIQLEMDVNKINKGSGKRNKIRKATTSKLSDWILSFEIAWDLDVFGSKLNFL